VVEEFETITYTPLNGKRKGVPVPKYCTVKVYRGVEVKLHAFLTSALVCFALQVPTP